MLTVAGLGVRAMLDRPVVAVVAALVLVVNQPVGLGIVHPLPVRQPVARVILVVEVVTAATLTGAVEVVTAG